GEIGFDINELGQLFSVDEKQTHSGVGQKISKILRLVEIGNDDRHRSKPNGAKPHRYIVEAIGTKQEQPRFWTEPNACKRRGISRDLLSQLQIGDYFVIAD